MRGRGLLACAFLLGLGLTSLTAGAWNTITVNVPSNAVTPLYQLGVQFATNAAWTGSCYIDSISW